MKLFQLFESTSDDLFRKIDALDAVIADKAATDNEKSNAKSLKSKLEARLKNEFPNAKRPSKTTSSTSSYSRSGNWDANFWADMARAAAAHKDREERWKKNPEEKKLYYKDKLRQLQNRRSALSKWRGMGNVEIESEYQQVHNTIENILRNEFPEEYAEIQKKRDEKANKAAEREYKKQIKKTKDIKAKAQKSGKKTLSEVGKEYEDVLKRFHNLMREKKALMSGSGFHNIKIDPFKNGYKTLNDLKYVKGLRMLWSELSKEDQEAVKIAIETVNDFGERANGYTPAQKKRILDSFRLSKAVGGADGPPRRYVQKNGKWYDLKLNKVKIRDPKNKWRYKWVNVDNDTK